MAVPSSLQPWYPCRRSSFLMAIAKFCAGESVCRHILTLLLTYNSTCICVPTLTSFHKAQREWAQQVVRHPSWLLDEAGSLSTASEHPLHQISNTQQVQKEVKAEHERTISCAQHCWLPPLLLSTVGWLHPTTSSPTARPAQADSIMQMLKLPTAANHSPYEFLQLLFRPAMGRSAPAHLA